MDGLERNIILYIPFVSLFPSENDNIVIFRMKIIFYFSPYDVLVVDFPRQFMNHGSIKKWILYKGSKSMDGAVVVRFDEFYFVLEDSLMIWI